MNAKALWLLLRILVVRSFAATPCLHLFFWLSLLHSLPSIGHWQYDTEATSITGHGGKCFDERSGDISRRYFPRSGVLCGWVQELFSCAPPPQWLYYSELEFWVTTGCCTAMSQTVHARSTPFIQKPGPTPTQITFKRNLTALRAFLTHFYFCASSTARPLIGTPTYPNKSLCLLSTLVPSVVFGAIQQPWRWIVRLLRHTLLYSNK